MNDVFQNYLAGEVAPHLALMMLFINCDNEENAREILVSAIRDAEPMAKTKLTELQDLWNRSPESYSYISKINGLARTGGATEERVLGYREAFDKAVFISAEASVALYSLGNPDLLNSITSEIVALMQQWELFDRNSIIAEIGCGTGRFQRFLAPHAGAIVGLDISRQMLRRASDAVRSFTNVLLVQVTGTDLSMLRNNMFNLVLAIDSFPYIVDAGGADVHFRDCARILTARGRMLLMNFEYGTDLQSQQERIASLAAKHGFAVKRNGTRDLRCWDGRSFLLEKLAT